MRPRRPRAAFYLIAGLNLDLLDDQIRRERKQIFLRNAVEIDETQSCKAATRERRPSQSRSPARPRTLQRIGNWGRREALLCVDSGPLDYPQSYEFCQTSYSSSRLIGDYVCAYGCRLTDANPIIEVKRR